MFYLEVDPQYVARVPRQRHSDDCLVLLLLLPVQINVVHVAVEIAVIHAQTRPEGVGDRAGQYQLKILCTVIRLVESGYRSFKFFGRLRGYYADRAGDAVLAE